MNDFYVLTCDGELLEICRTQEDIWRWANEYADEYNLDAHVVLGENPYVQFTDIHSDLLMTVYAEKYGFYGYPED